MLASTKNDKEIFFFVDFVPTSKLALKEDLNLNIKFKQYVHYNFVYIKRLIFITRQYGLIYKTAFLSV